MAIHKNILSIAVLLTIVVLIKVFCTNHALVEQLYANGVFVKLSAILIALFGWSSLSIGDVLYGWLIIWLLVKVVKYSKQIIKGTITRQQCNQIAIKFVQYTLGLYIVFNILWGINYNRIGVAKQLQLEIKPYKNSDLVQIEALLTQKVNIAKNALLLQNIQTIPRATIFNETKQAYINTTKKYPFIPTQNLSLKSSLWGWLGNYTGFLGYYNPLTAEAQVNTTVPSFIQPFVCCHEVAHQLGYAKENEANFVGYLAATASNDTFFHYSVYIDLWMYAHKALYLQDSALAKKSSNLLLPAVKADLKLWNNFNQQHQNPIEPFIRWLYGKYLLSNQQPAGIMSYDEVTGFLVAYYKKYGKI